MKKQYKLITLLSIIMVLIMTKEFTFATEQTIIAIDPGHGGENLGALYTNQEGIEFVEKEMTLITALAMKEELEKYDNVSVFLTREQDVIEDISLANRAQFAKDKGANVLISLHYNKSVSGILYGSEVWVPSKGQIYSDSSSLATEFIHSFNQLGLFNRGIKTRLNKTDGDYYGILRESFDRGLNAILVEHCHMENPKDHGFYNSEDNMKALGRANATAVAKYYRLSSTLLGVDYSNHTITAFPIPGDIVRPDITAPEYCEVELLDYNKEAGTISFDLKASDSDGYILYYTYSLDNGATWIPLLGWENKEKITISDTITLGETPNIIGKVYNGYDMSSQSNVITLPKYEEPILVAEVNIPVESVEIIEDKQIVQDQRPVLSKDNIVKIYQDEIEPYNMVKQILLVSFIILIILYIPMQIYILLKKQKQFSGNFSSRNKYRRGKIKMPKNKI